MVNEAYTSILDVVLISALLMELKHKAKERANVSAICCVARAIDALCREVLRWEAGQLQLEPVDRDVKVVINVHLKVRTKLSEVFCG